MTDHGDKNIRGLKDSGRTNCPCSIMFCCCEERRNNCTRIENTKTSAWDSNTVNCLISANSVWWCITLIDIDGDWNHRTAREKLKTCSACNAWCNDLVPSKSTCLLNCPNLDDPILSLASSVLLHTFLMPSGMSRAANVISDEDSRWTLRISMVTMYR